MGGQGAPRNDLEGGGLSLLFGASCIACLSLARKEAKGFARPSSNGFVCLGLLPMKDRQSVEALLGPLCGPPEPM